MDKSICGDEMENRELWDQYASSWAEKLKYYLIKKSFFHHSILILPNKR